MNFKEVADNYSKEKRKMMTDAVIRNKNQAKINDTYHSSSLNTMFAEWHLLFPSHKQQMSCHSCRLAVCKFWETMVNEWIEIEQAPKNKTNVKKTKKHKAK